MPAGPSPLGFVYFTLVKFAGYTAYCRWVIQPRLQPMEVKPPSAWLAGVGRTLLGLAVGTVVGLGFWNIPWFGSHDQFSEWLFFLLLAPVRVFEWWALLRWAYSGWDIGRSTKTKFIAGGILTSFGLDFLGIVVALVTPGGVWVC